MIFFAFLRINTHLIPAGFIHKILNWYGFWLLLFKSDPHENNNHFGGGLPYIIYCAVYIGHNSFYKVLGRMISLLCMKYKRHFTKQVF